VPVYADEGADAGAVRISPRVVQNLGIRTAEVTLGKLERRVSVVGSVAFDERAVAVVQARTSGYIDKLLVRAPLDRVSKGQPLAEILAPDWVAAQQEYLTLKASPLASDTLRTAARQRLISLGMPEETVAALDATGKPHARITLTAPISGVVGELAVREGMTVMPGAMLFRLNGLSTVWVNAEVPEAQAAWLKPGIAVTATVPAYPGELFKGKVAALLPEINAATRTLKGRIELANPQGHLAPGMFASVTADAGASQAVLQVPSEAVIPTGKRSVVIVAGAGEDGKPQFSQVDVETGLDADGMTEIRSGLAKGQKVVLSGQFLIDSEASLKATGTRMGAAPGTAIASAPAGEVHKGTGKVERIGNGNITLSHGAIASMQMGAMTMDYKLAPAIAPGSVKVGATVAFEVTMTPQGEMVVTRISDGGGKK
jgi:Cu(I)/Ag(I) efflux system membrane fusion protein